MNNFTNDALKKFKFANPHFIYFITMRTVHKEKIASIERSDKKKLPGTGINGKPFANNQHEKNRA